MTHYLKTSSGITITSGSALNVYNTLPSGVYRVSQEPMQPMRLVPVDSFTLPDRLYGETEERADKIIRSFEICSRSTGVLMVGTKGSGKSVLARCIGRKLEEQGIPTIIIPYNQIDDGLVVFLDAIDSPCMVLFDEIDKIKPTERTNCLLGLLDGVSGSKKLFVLTANDEQCINSAFLNRPGRVLYRYQFGGLSEEVIREYCQEHGMSSSYMDEVVSIAAFIRDFSFDILRAIVYECKTFDTSPKKTLEYLNVRPEMSGLFDVSVIGPDGRPWMASETRIYLDFNQRRDSFRISALDKEKLPESFVQYLSKRFDTTRWRENNWYDGADNWKQNYASEASIGSDNADVVALLGAVTACIFEEEFDIKSYTSMQDGCLVYKATSGHTIRLQPSPYGRSYGAAYRF